MHFQKFQYKKTAGEGTMSPPSRNSVKLTNKSVFKKTMDKVRKHRDIKLVATDKRRNQLVSEPNYHTAK